MQDQGQKVNLSQEQVVGAARAGLNLLNHPDGSVPNQLRKPISVLEIILELLGSGQAILANPPEKPVELPPEPPKPPVKESIDE